MKSKKSKSGNKLPFIAIVGKPNVGKSSLFNRIVGRKVSITSEQAGTTRDRVFQRCIIEDINAILVDTGGLEYDKKADIEADMQSQAHVAIAEADLVLFVVDGKSQPTIDDYEAAKILRRQSKKIIFVANKIDNAKNSHNLPVWTELGFGQPNSISVIHNLGVEKLESIVKAQLEELGWTHENTQEEVSDTLRLAVIGRPNAGKSSLINAFVGQERVIVSDTPGTTRDAIDIEVTKDNHHFTLIDTAGLRRRGKIEQGIEKFSSFRTINAIERADVVCLVLDYSVGVRAQDLHISSYIMDAHKGLMIVINKIDLMEDKEDERNRIGRILKNRFDYLSWAPVLFVSAKNKKNLGLVFETAGEIFGERKKVIDQEALVDFLKIRYRKHQPAAAGRNKLLFYDFKQITGAPSPTFEFLVNNEETIHFSYKRYLENEFREQFGFLGTSINFLYKNIDKRLARKAKPF